MNPLHLQIIDRIDDIEPDRWNALVAKCGGSVLCQHAFLKAFEQSKSVCAETGWKPQHLLLWDAQGAAALDPATAVLAAAVPLYAKGHSYGEFVFDWAWADAYQRHGLQYYPKWLAAVPFTPVPGPRLLTTDTHRAAAAQALVHWAKESGLSSLHVLYTTEADTTALCAAGCLARTHTQFHWMNRGWADFEAFLASLTQSKRKKIRAERRKVKEAGVTTQVVTGSAITPAHWDIFYRCYANTYHQRGNAPYLTPAFFEAVAATLSNHCVIALASQGEQTIAASLLWLDTSDGQRRLYGRYWGALKHVDCLHFELAYYTPLEWALQHDIAVIEGGAQGEHKLARGFEPVQTRSAHWLAHPAFADAVERFLEQERTGVDHYMQGLQSPFKPEVGD